MLPNLPFRNNLISSGLFFFFIFLLHLFSLPALSFWRLNVQNSVTALSRQQLLDYRHPPLPIVQNPNPPPMLTNYYLLIDDQSNQIILGRNYRSRIFPASITKLATALTALNVYPLDEIIKVNQEYRDGKVMELKTGENITVASLVTALLIYSANDAAYTLAAHHPRGLPGFITEMNQVANKFGLNQTQFSNVDGIHHPNHYATIYDLSQLARASIKMDIIRQTALQTSATVTDTTGQISHQLTSTNELLGRFPEVEGLKTGWTPEAGGCFVGLFNINGHYLISVIAQSPDRFTDTVSLLNWAKNNLTWGAYSATH